MFVTQTGYIDELWVAFATGKSFRYLPAHEIALSNVLLFLHAFSGCNTISSFAGRRKKTAWEIWKMCDKVTPAFAHLHQILILVITLRYWNAL